MNNIQAKNFIKTQRSLMSSLKRKRTSNRKRTYVSYPLATEKSYAVKISDYMQGFIDNINTAVVAFNNKHFDDDSSDVDALWVQMENEFVRYFGTSVYASVNLGAILKKIAERVLGSDSLYMQKQLEIISGVSFSVDTPWWDNLVSLWEQENYRLIKSMGNEYITKVNQIILNGISNGYSLSELSDQIKSVGAGLTEAHSRLIARDQIGKLNSLILKNQSTYIGINTYYWQTARDERVRGNPTGKYSKAVPSHWIMEGLLCSWENSDVYSDDLGKTWKQKTDKMEHLQVGMAIQCRCEGAPSWNQYVQNIDDTIGRTI